jgi:hypothetical protein
MSGPHCRVCSHPQVDEINVSLAAHVSIRKISERFRTKLSATYRHSKNHMPVGIIEAARAVELVRAEDILAQLGELQASALAVLKKAESVGDLRAATGAITSARGNLELIARLIGELREGPTVNLIVAPEWITMRGTIIAALLPYPEAAYAVSLALRQLAPEPSALTGPQGVRDGKALTVLALPEAGPATCPERAPEPSGTPIATAVVKGVSSC